jgi:tetratricopeptide (TPR) repeat protein
MRILSYVLILLVAVLWPVAGYAGTDDPALIEQAKVAIAKGDISDAEIILSRVPRTHATENDLDFLHGMAAASRGDYEAAANYFSSVLVRDPAAQRVRLELARVYFITGKDRAAEHHFRAAAAQGVPPPVAANIAMFLEALKRRKRWNIEVAFAAVPDSNMNAATASRSIDIFGLPFDLSDAARQKSGVGLALNVTAARLWTVKEGLRLRTGLSYAGTEYSNSEFSDRQIGAFAGPQFRLSKRTDATLLATASRRWFGEDSLNSAVGGRLEIHSELSARWLLDGAVSVQQMRYNANRYPGYSGPTVGVSGTATYALSAVSLLQASTGFVREQTDLPGYRNSRTIVGAGYYYDKLPGRFTVAVGAQSAFSFYDERLAGFSNTRRDVELSYRISFSNKLISIFGFRPVVTYVHTDRYSNLPLYGYHRDHGEIGAVRNL